MSAEASRRFPQTGIQNLRISAEKGKCRRRELHLLETFFPERDLKIIQALLYTFRIGSRRIEALSLTINSKTSARAAGFTQSSGFTWGMDLRFNAVSSVLGAATAMATFLPLASSFRN